MMLRSCAYARDVLQPLSIAAGLCSLTTSKRRDKRQPSVSVDSHAPCDIAVPPSATLDKLLIKYRVTRHI